MNVHILPTFGSRQIGGMVPSDIQAVVNSWSSKLSPRTVIRIYGVLRALFSHAVNNDWLVRSPCRNVKLPRVDGTRRHDLAPEDVTNLSAAMAGEYQAMVPLGAVLGLRWGEVAGLRVGRVDVLGRKLKVEETVSRDGKGRVILGPPKSKASTVMLTMPKKFLGKKGTTESAVR